MTSRYNLCHDLCCLKEDYMKMIIKIRISKEKRLPMAALLMEVENVLIVLHCIDGDVEFDDNIKPRPFDHLDDFHLMVDEEMT